MRFFKYVLAFAVCCLTAYGCLEVDEEIAINDDGSGVYNSKMDMSALVELMQTFAGEEKMKEEGLDKAIDTVINFSSILDSAKELSAEQKVLLKDAKMHMQMNMKENLFKINMNIPYKDFASLKKLLETSGGGSGAMSEVMKGAISSDKNDEQANNEQPDFGNMTNFYTVTVEKGLISKKVDQEKFQQMMARPEMAQMSQMKESGMEILYTTSIKLPRPVKKIDNDLFKLSDDKKTVTMKYNMLEMLSTPEKFNFTIEY
jgi:hypothetical protein